MGQTYDVYLKLNIDSEDEIKRALRKYINENNGTWVRFDLDGKDLDDFDQLMQVFITDRGYQKYGDYDYQSGFDASYGWESILYKFFEVMTPYLKNDSYILVYPDSGHTKITAKDGEPVYAVF